MKLHELLHFHRKSKKISLMQLVKETGLSYGKIYRIFNGTLAKPLIEDLKKIAISLSLDLSQLMIVAGYIDDSAEDESEYPLFSYPILDWDFLTMIYPFKQAFTKDMSNELCHWSVDFNGAFAVRVDEEHAYKPYFFPRDIILCHPHATYKHFDRLLFIHKESKIFSWGVIVIESGKQVIRPVDKVGISIVVDDEHDFECLGKVVLHDMSHRS